MTKNQEEALAMRVRALFCREMHRRGNTGFGKRPMPAFDGGITRDGRRAQSAWNVVAKIIADYRFDPAIYVGLMFWNNTRFPNSSDVKSKTLIERYQRYIENMPTRLSAIYKSGAVTLGSLMRELDKTNYTEQVKTELALAKYQTSTPSPLLHYCFALAAGRPDLVANKRAEVVSELAVNPAAYRRAWPAGFIPDDIYNEAQTIRNSLDSNMRQYA